MIRHGRSRSEKPKTGAILWATNQTREIKRRKALFMKETILTAQGDRINEISRKDWEAGLAAVPDHVAARLAFMTEEHHRVRNFVVRELPRVASPLTPEFITASLNLSAGRVKAILDDLEKHMTFLFRNEQGAVVWAYPVTVEPTPHRVGFSTGERLYAA
jgi:hypothetical protein